MGEEKQQTSFTEDDLNLIHEVSVSIHSIQDLDEMLRSVLHKIKDVFHIEGVSIALHDPERGEFYFIQTVEEEKDQDLERMKRMRFS
ncbi:MAG: hypothetical protein SVW57_14625, partial [Thermodesulfobacteriota bacterium]|nr:hypothetical protein [Thermodesulfobacteriota bacterium]